MIKATCIPCGADLGSFRDREEYLSWRSQTGGCPNCGASLDTSLFTSYVKGEHPTEEPVVDEAGERTEEGTGEAKAGANTERVNTEKADTEETGEGTTGTGEANNILRNFLRRGR